MSSPHCQCARSRSVRTLLRIRVPQHDTRRPDSLERHTQWESREGRVKAWHENTSVSSEKGNLQNPGRRRVAQFGSSLPPTIHQHTLRSHSRKHLLDTHDNHPLRAERRRVHACRTRVGEPVLGAARHSFGLQRSIKRQATAASQGASTVTKHVHPSRKDHRPVRACGRAIGSLVATSELRTRIARRACLDLKCRTFFTAILE